MIVLDHLTEVQKRAHIVADNQLALNAGWNDDVLRSELVRLLAAQDATQGLTDEDAAPELQRFLSRPAGIFGSLGITNLLVGDATNQSDVTTLMAGDAAGVVFLDPPYNVDYEDYTEDHLKIQATE